MVWKLHSISGWKTHPVIHTFVAENTIEHLGEISYVRWLKLILSFWIKILPCISSPCQMKFHPIRLWKFCKVTHMNSIPWVVEIYGMKIHPKFIHHIFSHLYQVFPIFLLKQLKFICCEAHSVMMPLVAKRIPIVCDSCLVFTSDWWLTIYSRGDGWVNNNARFNTCQLPMILLDVFVPCYSLYACWIFLWS